MVEEKKYYPDKKPNDLQVLHEDGGGMLMNDQGKFMFSSLSPEKTEELKTINFNGNVKTNFNDISIVGIFNQNSQPQTTLEEGNSNKTSIINPTTQTAIQSPLSNNSCGGTNKDNNEFGEASKIFSLWENLNSNNGDEDIKFYQDNSFTRSSNFINTLINDPKIVSTITSNISLNETKFKNLGWNNFGSGKKSLRENIDYFFTDYWLTNAQNELGKDKTYFKQVTNPALNITDQRNIFDIQILPSGLRTMALRNCYNSGKLWIVRILAAIGPDYMPNSGLGITIKESRSDGLSFEEKKKKWADQYDQIITLYNKDKQSFLELLAKETKDFYTRYTEQQSTIKESTNYDRFSAQPSAFKTFYNTYVDLSLNIALKYKDCPNEYQISGTVTTTESTPAKTEDNKAIIYTEDYEGLYEAEFEGLPTNEDEVIIKIDNDGVETAGGVNEGNVLIIQSKGKVVDVSNEKKSNNIIDLVTINSLNSSKTGGSSNNIYTLEATGVVSDDINNALKTCKPNSANVLEVAVKMNPRGAGIFNKKLPEWSYGNDNLILQAIQNKLGCPTNLHCGAGISLSFIIFNQDDYKTKSNESGGFPLSNSSYIVPSKQFNGNKVSFEKGTDWDPKTQCLTPNGIQKFEQAQKFTGGIFTVGDSSNGHTGMIWYLSLEEIKDKKGNLIGKRGTYYTLEFNTAAKNQSSGGQLAFRKRVIGGSWGARCGGDTLPVWLGDTGGFKGGNWALKGLGNSNTYTFGESVAYAKNIK